MMSRKQCIFLIGMMGSGKTTIGEIVAERLARKFFNLDGDIEYSAGKSISAIFAEDGEAHFRQMESELLTEMSQTERAVVACGGGIILRKGNRRIMRESGTVFFLDVPLETLARRLNGVNDRPLLSNPGGNESSLSIIWQEREEFYHQTAHITIDASLPPQSCADAILTELEL